jgi:dTDP-4-dehydrorhamnose 3,5-epimerase-like enzyme
MPINHSSISALRLVELPHHVGGDGDLSVLEKAHLPFAIVRLFFVRATVGARRGMHAHRRCSQFMMCVNGAIEVTCDDSEAKRTLVLDRPNLGILVPPSIWATEIYREAGSVLAVACDRPYEEDDYIRDYDEFRRYRALAED